MEVGPQGLIMLPPLRDPDGDDELVMDAPAVKYIMREHFAKLATDPNPLPTAEWEKVAGFVHDVHPPELPGLTLLLFFHTKATFFHTKATPGGASWR